MHVYINIRWICLVRYMTWKMNKHCQRLQNNKNRQCQQQLIKQWQLLLQENINLTKEVGWIVEIYCSLFNIWRYSGRNWARDPIWTGSIFALQRSLSQSTSFSNMESSYKDTSTQIRYCTCWFWNRMGSYGWSKKVTVMFAYDLLYVVLRECFIPMSTKIIFLSNVNSKVCIIIKKLFVSSMNHIPSN